MSRKKKKTTSKKSTKTKKKPNVGFRLLDYLQSFPKKNFTYKQLQRKFINDYDKGEIVAAINQLLEKGKVERTGANSIRFATNRSRALNSGEVMEGKLDMSSRGFGFIIHPDMERDVFVAGRKLGQALDKDIVTFRVYKKGTKDSRPEGEILSVVKRMQDHYVGSIQVRGAVAYLVPDSEKMPYDIKVALKDLNNAEHGDKVVVKITGWPTSSKTPVGIVVDNLGTSGENDVEMKSILIENGFKLTFPDEVIKETERIPDVIEDEEIERRHDMRDVPTFTIDPEDAKDFDDALSFRHLENDRYEIGVHIADVTHYVKPGTALDKEAFERATSVYLVDRVSPMFPEKISNIVCSLRPHEDKLAFSALFTMDKTGKVYDTWFGRTVIHSDHRFTYRSAQDVLDGKESGPLAKELKILNGIAEKLREERMKVGSIGFESQEVRFKLDKQGKPLEVVVKEILPTNELIEDYMLLANKYVAKYNSAVHGAKEPAPNVFRVHDPPDMMKLEQFAEFARKFGYNLKFYDNQPEQIAATLNDLLKRLKGKKEENVLTQLAIRTMSKAFYTTKNVGHYGLAFDYYSHFTSPIRRYPDVLVHRVLENVLKKQKPPYGKEELEEMSSHCSIQERNAMTAERESVKYKQVEYLSEHIGEEFDGIISGVIARGIFVELEANKCEGFIPENKLAGGSQMIYDDARLTLTDTYGENIYQFGDKIRVRVHRTDLERRQVDFELVEDEEENTGRDLPDEGPNEADFDEVVPQYKPKPKGNAHAKPKKSADKEKTRSSGGKPKASGNKKATPKRGGNSNSSKGGRRK